jgi:hypothetical protein
MRDMRPRGNDDSSIPLTSGNYSRFAELFFAGRFIPLPPGQWFLLTRAVIPIHVAALFLCTYISRVLFSSVVSDENRRTSSNRRR